MLPSVSSLEGITISNQMGWEWASPCLQSLPIFSQTPLNTVPWDKHLLKSTYLICPQVLDLTSWQGETSNNFGILNSLHPHIIFPIEVEESSQLPFLDVQAYRKPDGSVGHNVYHKPTRTHQYLHATCLHHTAHQRSVLCTFIHRAERLSDEDSLQMELEHQQSVFLGDSYSSSDILMRSGTPMVTPGVRWRKGGCITLLCGSII